MHFERSLENGVLSRCNRGAGLFTFRTLSFDCHMIHRIIYWMLLLPFSLVFRCVFPFRVRGIENLPRQGGYILAGNHTGWLDSLIIATACPQPITFIAKKRFFSWRPLGWIMKITRQIPWERGGWSDTMTASVSRLQNGGVVCVFPEGRVTYDGQLGRFRRGVRDLQKSSEALVVPFCIHGGFEAWSCNQKYPTRRPIWIEFGTPDNHVDPKEMQANILQMKRDLEHLEDLDSKRE